MGIGNVTELVDADTTGMNALLFGIIAELGITDVLAVQVSPHCRRALREADRARRLMHAAKRLGRLPVGIDASLMALRDRQPLHRRRSGDRRDGGADPRRQFPHRARRRRHPSLQPRPASRRRSAPSTSFPVPRSRRTARMPSISASSSPAPRSPGSSASATSRTRISTGTAPPTGHRAQRTARPVPRCRAAVRAGAARRDHREHHHYAGRRRAAAHRSHGRDLARRPPGARALPPLAHARQSRAQRRRRHQSHRRRPRLCRLPDRPARLAGAPGRSRRRLRPRPRRWRIRSSPSSASRRTPRGRAFTAASCTRRHIAHFPASTARKRR